MRALLFPLALIAAPAAAQEMDHSAHQAAPAPAAPAPAATQPADDMAGMDHSAHQAAPAQPAPADDMAGMDHSAHSAAARAPADTPGDAPPPPAPTDHAADRFFSPAAMAAARHEMHAESRFRTTGLRIDQLEYRAVNGTDGYGLMGEVWTGGDLNRFVLSGEGEGELRHAPERVELAAKWRRAIDPWFNVEVGVRHDFRPDPERSYALVGVEGLAPYWIEVEAQLFLSNKGDLHARLGASHDWRLTQRLILQPEFELDVAFQDVPALGIGGGLDALETGLRLRYEIAPEFAPYVGVHWEQKFGGSARYARAAGERASAVSAVAGLRIWF